MSRRAKIACSLDAGLLARVERIRRATGETRSAVIARALAILTNDEARTAQIHVYQGAYRQHPEGAADVESARERARSTLVRLPWDGD